jgi:hypothetical protein
MFRARPFATILNGTVVLGLLTGCSGAGYPGPATPLSAESRVRAPVSPSVLLPGGRRLPVPDRSIGFAQPDASSKTALVVSDDLANSVSGYTRAGILTGKITGLFEPQGLAADAAGDIYIANATASNIVVYKRDLKTQILTLDDPNEYPVDVDIDAAASLVGVANIDTTSNTAGSVSFYSTARSKRAGDYRYIKQPCVTVGDATWAQVFFGAFDASGNFYIDGLDATGNVLVGVVTGGCKATAITTLTTGNVLGYPGGVRVTTTGKVAIDDQQAATVFTYEAALNGSLGEPIASTPLTGASDPVTFSFTKSGTLSWVADATNADAFDVTYPAGRPGPQEPIKGFTEPIGVVAIPAAAP